MRFCLEIPDPAVMRVSKVVYRTLQGGRELHRIHPSVYKSDRFNATAKGNARFSPIRSAAGTVVPKIYGAESFECATCEIILRDPDVPPMDPKTGLPTFQIIYPADFANYSHSVIRLRADLKLVDVTIAGQRPIGIGQNGLLAGPKSTYPATRGWAEAIHARCPTAQGLYYSSFQLGPLFAVVLFGDRLVPGDMTPVSTRLVRDEPCHSAIAALAQTLSIEYADV